MSEINKEFNLALNAQNSAFLGVFFAKFRFSFQERKQIAEICADLQAWDESVEEILLAQNFEQNSAPKMVFAQIKSAYEALKLRPQSYANFSVDYDSPHYEIKRFKGKKIALGRCPVASEGTRCCNLLTLDAVNSCGFDCSYCAIGSFYKSGVVGFDENFARNLSALKFDPDEIYHIGTGQSSDSLMWGDHAGILSALMEFAKAHSNVILELKSKSANVGFLLENEIPRNVIVTFSLNPQIIVQNEEHLSASLNSRLEAAAKLARKGILVGFHFHPMVHFEGWQSEYGAIFERLLREFEPKSVALVSFGTLTFIRPVIKKLRARGLKSKITQMPFADANGKISYPYEIKREMFKFAYDSLQKWHGKVFFYLCMEDKRLWSEVFGYEYASNAEFEGAMKEAYMKKIKEIA